jgi:hypothetical protein
MNPNVVAAIYNEWAGRHLSNQCNDESLRYISASPKPNRNGQVHPPMTFRVGFADTLDQALTIHTADLV